ncbi:substrate-binding domain-containing protein [Albimonas sp. CAU 1670]|uniref:substrate-binding domain-containing protein n=1 Tax=Albimonas sp. CAU 1670 TaxID=3032599 RepID=UPI0023DB7227|nr:substrate-binding domain-containing protein [Albimonas sp. CAU 1670]MDF2233854.1 substrate-binding domain-containing protein [Albimonas sp. CAU 1670]
MAANRGRKVTILDIARELNVAPSTVSNALSGRRYVDEELVAKVKATAERLGYRANPVARRLRSGRASAIGLFSAMPFAVTGGTSRLGFMMEIAATAAEEAMRSGLSLMLIPPMEASPSVDDLLIDGALLIEPARDDPFAELLDARGLPVVRIGRQPGRDDAPAVDLRSGETAALLLRHLEETGARRIALITAAARRASHEETEAEYARFAESRGMAPVHLRLDESGGMALGRAEALRLLQEHPEVDAILAMVDVFAAGACQAAREIGRSIPGDLRIATRYDGPRSLAADPPLTAVNLGLPEVAREAVKMLIPMIEGDALVGPARAPDARLTVRASTVAG